MSHIKEPNGKDFIIESDPLTQKEKIEFAQKQYLNGRYLSAYQAEKDIEECLK